MISIEKFYKGITQFWPYSYQIKVAELLLNQSNIILSVPTGSGKTWASIMPFLYAQHNKMAAFPKKMIYSLPLRTLTNSIYSDVTEVLQRNEDFNGLTSIHTGEYQNDEHFESDIIFSTIDQTLSSFLCFPLSLSKRQANINAGALVGSYLVFDEFHLLEPKLSMATTLGILRILKNLCRFCVMTATLSEAYIKILKEAIQAEVISINDFSEDVAKINSLKIPKGIEYKKILKVSEVTINADTILKLHKQKTIVICNRVEKTQQMYNEIVNKDLKGYENLSGLKKTNIICLHSHFFGDDRKHKEKRLKELFGENSIENAILISTQVIEAGMDISCDTMHVEISPINSFLQRAGRCARWENQHGEIYVYNLLELEEKELLKIKPTSEEEQQQIKAINNKYLPYNKELCTATFEKLKHTSNINKNVSQQLVDDILAKQELNDFSLINQNDFNKAKIQLSWESCEKNMYSQTIRDIQNIEIAIIDYKKENKNDFFPYKYQTISLFKWSLIKWIKEILSKKDFEQDNDVIFFAEKQSENSILDFDTFDKDGFKLKPVRSIEPLKNCYDIVFVDKSIFNYTAEAGLEIGNGTICSPLKPYDKKEKEITEYKKDTFYQHNKALINCYEREFKQKLQFAFSQLNNYWGEIIDWDQLIKVMICIHDYGKLNIKWQKPMKKLQELKGNDNFNTEEVLAHSDYNELTDREIEKLSGAKYKPPHAGIGAFALIENVQEIIDVSDFEELGNCVATAILKHHGVDTESYPDFDITNKDYLQINELLKSIRVTAKLNQSGRGGKMIESLPTNNEEWIIYLFLVRVLRLCDQKATMNFEKYLAN